MKIRSIRRAPSIFAVAFALLMVVVPLARAQSTVVTGGTEGVNETGGHLLGAITSAGDLAWYGFEYGTTTAYGMESEIRAAAEGETPANIAVAGLEPETTYHYQLAAVTQTGEFIYGGDRTFTTRGPRKLRAAEYPATLMGAQAEGAALTMTFEGGQTFSCASTSMAGALEKAATEVELSPSLEGCKAFGFSSATAHANGCKYLVNVGAVLFGTFGIACPEGSAIEVAAGTCTVTISSQSGLSSGAVTTLSTTPTTVSVKANVSQLIYTKTRDGFLCPLEGTGQREDGAYAGTEVLSAKNSSNVAIDLRVGP